MEEWRRDYNEVRPHSAIGNKPPIVPMDASGASGPLRVLPPGGISLPGGPKRGSTSINPRTLRKTGGDLESRLSIPK